MINSDLPVQSEIGPFHKNVWDEFAQGLIQDLFMKVMVILQWKCYIIGQLGIKKFDTRKIRHCFHGIMHC